MSSEKEFAIIIAENFEEIQRNFKTGLFNHGYEYNEDILTDAFIKCNSTLKDHKMTKKEAIKYFWVAYLNRMKNNIKRNKISIGIPENYDKPDNIYNDDIDSIYNNVLQILSKEFGQDTTHAWKKYICKQKTYKELVESGEVGDNFLYMIKKIRKFLKTSLHDHPQIKELLENIRTA